MERFAGLCQLLQPSSAGADFRPISAQHRPVDPNYGRSALQRVFLPAPLELIWTVFLRTEGFIEPIAERTLLFIRRRKVLPRRRPAQLLLSFPPSLHLFA